MSQIVYYYKENLKFIDGYAPFLSMTSRETFLNVSDQTVAAPGPGHYDPAVAQDMVKVSKHWILIGY